MPLGLERAAPLPITAESPRTALEGILRDRLSDGPLVISFSGGLDSSLLLRMAARVAQTEGLPAPIAHTLRFPGVPEVDESAWQERAIRGLRLAEWIRYAVEPGELEALGPGAAAVLRREGLTWPPNLQFAGPAAAAARGGTVAYGVDGDGLFDTWRWGRVLAFPRRKARPHRSDLRTAALMMAPLLLRRRMLEKHPELDQPWLREHARVAVNRAYARHEAAEPRRWDRRVARYGSARYLGVARRALQGVAQAAGAQLSLPLAHPRLLAAVARAGGLSGVPGRVAAIETWFPGELDRLHVGRSDKVYFDRILIGEATREFAKAWDGTGVPDRLVDAEVLRDGWLSSAPDPMSTTLLQAAWLAGQAETPSSTSRHSTTSSSSSAS